MRILIFCHSLVSDWNHGNAHFLRGITAELMRRGHDVHVYEPAESWSRCNLEAEYGQWPIVQFHRRYPCLESTRYDAAIDLDAVGGALAGHRHQRDGRQTGVLSAQQGLP